MSHPSRPRDEISLSKIATAIADPVQTTAARQRRGCFPSSGLESLEFHMARQQQQLHQHGGVSLFHNPLSTKLTGKQSCCLKFSEAKNAECNECELVKSPLWDPTTRSLDTAKTLNSKPRENPTSRSRPRQTSRHRQNPNPWEEPCRMHGILSHPLRRAHGTAVGFITPRKEHWNPSAKDPARISLFVTYTPFGFGGVGSNSNSGSLGAEERWQSTY